MLKIIGIVLLIWIFGSIIYGFASGKVDYKPFKKEIELHPGITVIIVIVVLAIVYFLFR